MHARVCKRRRGRGGQLKPVAKRRAGVHQTTAIATEPKAVGRGVRRKSEREKPQSLHQSLHKVESIAPSQSTVPMMANQTRVAEDNRLLYQSLHTSVSPPPPFSPLLPNRLARHAPMIATALVQLSSANTWSFQRSSSPAFSSRE